MKQQGQRITVTRKGQELQDQLRDMMKQQPIQASVKQYQDNNHIDFDQNKQNASDQLNGYADIVENRLNSPQQIKDFLSHKFINKPLFVQRELDRVSQRIYQFGTTVSHLKTTLPSLDFRQTQLMKSKYPSNSSLMKSEIFSQTGGTFFKNAKTSEDSKTKKVNYVLFQEAKLERMITKYEKFNEKAKLIPNYEKNQMKGDNFMQNLLKRMEGQESETRVESIEEINKRMGDQLDLMTYNNQQKERLKITMTELHHNRYQKRWKELRLPGQKQNGSSVSQ